MTEKNLARADFYAALVLIVFGIAVTTLAFQMPHVTDRGQSPYSAPGLVPGFLGIIITFLSAVMFFRAIKRAAGQLAVKKDSVGLFFKDEGTRRMTLTILLCIFYAFSLGRVPFPVTTFVFVLAFILSFEYDRAKPLKDQRKKVFIAVLLAFCTSLVVTGVFQYLFLVNLP